MLTSETNHHCFNGADLAPGSESSPNEFQTHVYEAGLRRTLRKFEGHVLSALTTIKIPLEKNEETWGPYGPRRNCPC